MRAPEKEVYEEAIATARRNADLVVLVGPAAKHGRDPAAEAAGTLRAFDTVGGAAQFLRDALRPDDLVLLKSKGVLHLERVALAQTGEVTCERYHCPLLVNGEHCRLLRA